MTKKKAIIGAVVAVCIAAAIGGIIFLANYFATVDYWDLKIGEDTIAVFATEDEAKAVIEEIENHYVVKDAKVESVEITPAMTVVMTSYREKEAPKLTKEADGLIEHLLTGDEEVVTYEVEEGDTIWDIAYDHDYSIAEIEEMNPDIDLEDIYPGDKLSLSELNPIVDVETVQLITSTKEIEYEIEEEETDDLPVGVTKVDQEGKNGKKKVTELITSVNGKPTKVVEKKKEILKEAQKEIVLVGTGETVSAETSSSWHSDGETYSGSGQAVADFAVQFVGNPYEYGGSSLTHGADCSGFVMAVYNQFGVSLPHGANWMRNYGRGVSLDNAQPGDIVCYANHCAIYIGGGQIVHAIDYGYGIDITGLNYSGKPVLEVRRIFE